MARYEHKKNTIACLASSNNNNNNLTYKLDKSYYVDQILYTCRSHKVNF